MSRRGRHLSPFYLFAFILWSVLYGSAIYLLEPRFPDAAFFSQDNDAVFGVWIIGSAVSMFCGWLLRNRLQNRLSKQTFDRLEIGMGILFLIAVLILYHCYVPEFLRFFERNSYEIPRHAKLRSDRSRAVLPFDLNGSGADMGEACSAPDDFAAHFFI